MIMPLSDLPRFPELATATVPPVRAFWRSHCDRAIVVAGGVLAVCFFLPLVTPSSSSVAYIFWIQLVLSSTTFSFTTDAAVFGLLGMVVPYAMGLLLAGSAAARLLGWPRTSAWCNGALRGLLVLVGVGLIWSVPSLWLEELSEPKAAGVVVSGCVLAGVVLWACRRMGLAGSELSEQLGFFLSLGCLVWFTFLLISIPVEIGGYIALAASVLLVAAHGAQAWVIRPVAIREPVPAPVFLRRPLDIRRKAEYSISIES